MIPISEIFYSIQGEGKYIGNPSIFIRVGGCNLTCPGFSKQGCDSFYAVDKKYKKEWKNLTIEELQKEIEKYAGNPSIFIRVGSCNLTCPGFGKQGCDSFYAVDKKYKKEWQNLTIEELKEEIKKYLEFKPDLVITGGEPGLYFEKLYPLIEWFKGEITIETNATISPDFQKLPHYKKVAFAMSVKLSNSGEEYKKRVKKEVIKNIATNAPKSFFKFVVDRDLKSEIEEITQNIELPIYCMPLGATKEELEKNAPFVFDFSLKNGYRYSDRIHIRLFGKKRGV